MKYVNRDAVSSLVVTLALYVSLCVWIGVEVCLQTCMGVCGCMCGWIMDAPAFRRVATVAAADEHCLHSLTWLCMHAEGLWHTNIVVNTQCIPLARSSSPMTLEQKLVVQIWHINWVNVCGFSAEFTGRGTSMYPIGVIFPHDLTCGWGDQKSRKWQIWLLMKKILMWKVDASNSTG